MIKSLAFWDEYISSYGESINYGIDEVWLCNPKDLGIAARGWSRSCLPARPVKQHRRQARKTANTGSCNVRPELRVLQ
jgi:hypothetical protein